VSALSTYLAEGLLLRVLQYNLRQQASLLPRLLAVAIRSHPGRQYL
jgi:hypothetical protein